MTDRSGEAGASVQRETLFEIPKMDCPSEERLVRMALQSEPTIQSLSFDLDARQLKVWHQGESGSLLARLEPLGFGARIQSSKVVEGRSEPAAPSDGSDESRVLWQLLAINGTMFLLEVGLGVLAQSTGVLADSIDMFADAAVYGLSLYAVGRSVAHQHRAARLSGVLQLLLAAGVLVEVVRRAFTGSEPWGPLMMGVSVVALAANVACMALLSRHRTGGVHLRASWIFSTNDVLANLGVIAAGALVMLTGSPWPDLLIGTLVGCVVLAGAIRILRLARPGPQDG